MNVAEKKANATVIGLIVYRLSLWMVVVASLGLVVVESIACVCSLIVEYYGRLYELV